MSPPLPFVFLLLLVFLLRLPFSTSFSFNFSTFNSSTPQFITFQNDSFFDKVIKLTKNEVGTSLSRSVGRAVYREPLKLWDAASGDLADFTTHFSFAIKAFSATGYGDGLTFFLSPYPSTVPPDSIGGNLGLVSESTTPNGTVNFVAVEFDTFPNRWDPVKDHVGIDINSVESAVTAPWNSSFKDGSIGNAWVSYNASEKNLSVFLTFEKNPTFSGQSTLYHIIDLRDVLPETVAFGFSAATGVNTETHNILSWDFSSTLKFVDIERERKSSARVGLGLSLSIGLFLIAAGFIWFLLWRRRIKQETKEVDFDEEEGDMTIDDEFEKERGPKRFLYSELAASTKNFDEEMKLGEGGFGGVYKGVLKGSIGEVAIKRVSRGSKQGKKEYIAEVKIISQEGIKKINYRYKIGLGLASALLYLHEEWEECVVHRDIKPSNVMLDAAFNAKLGDFGLARLVDHDRGMQTTVLAGTMGYLSPESLTSGQASKESDVYAFGMVLLELACGRRPVEPKERPDRVGLVAWVWDLYGSGRMTEAADVRLGVEFDEEEMGRMMAVGLWCAHPDSGMRPTVRQALAVLKKELAVPKLPARMPVPMYCPPPPLQIIGSFTCTSSFAGSGFSGFSTTTGSGGVGLGGRQAEEPQAR
ncbi:L-type lectin-domain containing receptor kinase IX.1 [Dendrobium catenatum]|uniref:non-specific serine/threonine protein kinase n=1 Tax=Dendrobium catenatum TaxID=906689 RepID=A0A2I0VEY0_9ASPA|nr:L-type lectin-domain containing receptor kinase IX.1 [Dendrobium catenatum]